MSQELAQQIAKLAASQEKIAALLARNPAEEFVNSEGFVGAPKVFGPCKRCESFISAYGGGNSLVFQAQIIPQFWRLSYRAIAENYSGTGSTFFNMAFAIYFSDNANFAKSLPIYIYPKIEQFTANFGVANTACLLYTLNEEFPIRDRFVKIVVGQYFNASQAFTPVPPGVLSLTGPFFANVFGD